MNVSERRYSDDDFPRVLDLLGACLLAGYVDAELLSTNLRLNLSNPDFDRRNALILERDRQMVGFAILWQGRYLGMLVHPGDRGQLEPSILTWAEGTRSSAGATDGLVILCRDDDALMTQFCERHGVVLVDDELRMGRQLTAPLPTSPRPEGFGIRPLDGPDELDAWLALYAEAFGSRPSKLRHWRAMRDDPDHRPELDLVAVSDDGQLAGFCYCSIASFEAAVQPTVEGRTEPIAVSHLFQRRGLARALICTGLEALRRNGADSVLLTTEAENVAAHRLYGSLGYHELYRARWYHLTN